LDFLDTEILGNAVRSWIGSAAVLLAFLIAYAIVKRIAATRLTELSSRTRTGLDDALAAAVEATHPWLLALIAIHFAARSLTLPEGVTLALSRIAMAAALIQVGFWAGAAIRVMMESWKDRRWGDDPEITTTFRFVTYAVNVAVWAIVFLVLLENLGVDISALVAGLGIGGIAVALAVQNILGDLFASLSIILDKPFVIGDYLAVDDLGGTVQSIGLNSTRITSLSGEQLVFSNKDLLQSRIRNFGRMEERRVLFRIGVVYGTRPDRIEQIPGMIRSAVERQELARFDRSHFKEFGDSALIFETVYYMTVPDYGTYMNVQQSVNLDILRQFAAGGIAFAYPTQHLFLETVGPAGTAPADGGRGSVDGPRLEM
jgi:small-conductance mechanosensitive channel